LELRTLDQEEYLRSFKRRYKLEPITVLKGLDVIPLLGSLRSGDEQALSQVENIS
jgi:hypothetical protein